MLVISKVVVNTPQYRVFVKSMRFLLRRNSSPLARVELFSFLLTFLNLLVELLHYFVNFVVLIIHIVIPAEYLTLPNDLSLIHI